MERKFGIVQKPSSMIENVVFQNLIFKFSDNLEAGFCDLQNVGYWYSSEGKEIDFIAGEIPIELKYQNVINKSDLSAIKLNGKSNTFFVGSCLWRMKDWNRILQQLKVYFEERVSEYLLILTKWSLHKNLAKLAKSLDILSTNFKHLN